MPKIKYTASFEVDLMHLEVSNKFHMVLSMLENHVIEHPYFDNHDSIKAELEVLLSQMQIIFEDLPMDL
jgi:hypothetical protein